MKLFYATPTEWRGSCLSTAALIALLLAAVIRAATGRLVKQ